MSEAAEPDWYLREWMAHLNKRQADFVRERGWPKGRVSKFVNGTQPYRREVLNTFAAWLQIEPFELLMPPASALAYRRLRDTAVIIAEDAQREMTGT